MFSNRRDFLRLTSCGFPYLAAASMATAQAMAAKGEYKNPLAPKAPHFEPKVKRVIFLFMSGAPSQNETFDYNEDLEKSGGKTGERSQALLPSIFKFERRGQSGLPISELFPHLSAHADDLCLVNGMQTNSPAHPQASIFLHTGSITFVRPSIGAWAVYGLGTENQALPGFVTLNPAPNGGAQLYGSAFLPATFQGTRIAVERGQAPIDNIRNAKLSAEAQRRQIDLVQEMNREMLERSKVDSELDGLIESFELAFRMQTSVPDVIDIKREPEAVREMYGLNGRNTRDFGTQCLIARRMAEAGVRFIELHHPGWDQHNQLKARLTQNAAEIDKPIAALLTDLKQRSLLKDTLLVWGGEFGRSTWQQGGSGDGRQHNSRGYTMWLAGGGVKGGIRYGRCDANGVAVENAVHLHDLHATILHLMGLDHKRLTFRYAGRDFRLTDVHGEVVKGILV
ncbi:MAG: DUF1501 domain-containing protein [Bryobacterales bacterium]|nr:DUF1501 domain-containing protein [Bryobacterales bacterium]